MVTQEVVQEFKDRMHITHSNEDDNLIRLLSFSVSAIKSICGKFDLEGASDTDIRAKELVLERTRYAYNDALEFFEDNFLSELNSLGISIALKEVGDPDAAI